MRVTRDDLPRLRGAAVLAIGMIAAGAALALLAGRWHQAEEAGARRALAEREELRSKLVRARAEQDEILRVIERFRTLAASGLIGEERRLDWSERIQGIAAARRLGPIRYEIAPRHPMAPEAPADGRGGFGFFASRMRLELPLLHEGDLLGLLEDLRRSPGALVVARECSIERPRQPLEGAGLEARCSLDWITVRETRP